MPTGQGLADLLSGAAGAPIDRPKLDAFVATSQAKNGLVSAQTQDALIKASQAQEQMAAHGRIKDELMANDVPESEASLARDFLVGSNNGDSVTALKALGMAKLGYGSPQSQTGGQQMVEGKLAPPVATPANYQMPPGSGLAGVPEQQSTQGAAQTALTQQQTATSKALSGYDIAHAEEEHAKAKQAASASSMNPMALEEAARVTMADPSKMSGYAGYGASGQKNKDAINNRRAQMLNDANMTTDDMIRQRAITKASVGAAGQAAKQAQVLDAFMPLVKANGDRIMQLLDQIDATGVGVDEPIVNGFERMLGRKLNSDDMTELHSVFTTYQKEIARLLAAGPSMNGVISDHSQRDVESMAPENMSSSGARRVLNRIDVETGIRRQGVQHSLEEAAGAQLPVISNPRGTASGPAATGGAGSAPAGLTLLN